MVGFVHLFLTEMKNGEQRPARVMLRTLGSGGTWHPADRCILINEAMRAVMIDSASKQSGMRGRDKQQSICAIKRAGRALPAMIAAGECTTNGRSKTPDNKRRRMLQCLSRHRPASRLVVSKATERWSKCACQRARCSCSTLDVMLGRPPTGPREAWPDDRLRSVTRLRGRSPFGEATAR